MSRLNKEKEEEGRERRKIARKNWIREMERSSEQETCGRERERYNETERKGDREKKKQRKR